MTPRVIHLIALVILLETSYSLIEPVAFTYNISTSTFTCLKSKDYTSVTYNVDFTQQGTNPKSIQNLVNGLNSGLLPNFVVIPCRGNGFELETKRILQFYEKYSQSLKKKPMIWIAASAGRDQYCNWYQQENGKNCQYLLEIGKALYKKNIKVGIPLLPQTWNLFYGGQCAGAESLFDLMYIKFDEEPNFDHYEQIGMWKSPSAKLYTDDFICGESFSMLYTPN